MPHFRLLHLSDLHLAEEANHLNRADKIREIFNGALSDVSLRAPGIIAKQIAKPTTHSSHAKHMLADFCVRASEAIDAILITGDLATTGRDVDLAEAKQYVESPVASAFLDRDGRPTLAAAGRRIFLMPGNHDRYRGIVPKPNSGNFENYFPNSFPTARRVHSLTRKKSGSPIRFGVVLGDFSLRKASDATNLRRVWGTGHAYGDIISDMIAESSALRRQHAGIYLMWAIHFAPFACGDDLEFVNGSNVIAAAKNIGVEFILCGHTHKKEKVTINGVTIYCAGASCAMDCEGNHMAHILDIIVDGGRVRVSRENYRLAPPSDIFEYLDTD